MNVIGEGESIVRIVVFALAATLPDTRIETIFLSPISDAGGVETRRRRWLCFSNLSSSFMVSIYSSLVVFSLICYHLNLAKSFRFVHASLPAPAPSSSLMTPYVVMHRREASVSGSDFFSGFSRRSLTTIVILRLFLCLEIAVGDLEAGLDGRGSPIIFLLEISAWLPSLGYHLWLAPIIERNRHLCLEGRGHFSRLVSTVPIWFWFCLLRWRALVWSVLQGSWSDLVSPHSSLYILFSEISLLVHRYSRLIGRGHQISFASISLSWLWRYIITLLCCALVSLLKLLIHGGLFVVKPRPDWSVSIVALSMRVWSRFGRYLNPYATKYLLKVRVFIGCATGLIVLSLLYYSFEKRLQHSSHWERSLPQSSIVKERTFPSSWLSSRDRVVSFVLARIHSTFGTVVATLIDALGIVYVTVLGGKRCFLTSMSFSMTRQYLWGFNTTTLPTHLDFVSDSLSFSLETLSISLMFIFVMYGSKFRGCFIPSFICKTQG